MPGEIVLLRMPQPDLLEGKLRPVLVLSALPGRFGDVLVWGVSSQLHQEIPQWDERLTPDDPDFATSGLKVASVTRLYWLAAVSPDVSVGALGFIAQDRLLRLRQRLAAQFASPSLTTYNYDLVNICQTKSC
jgi:mRNA interferase MazF